MLRFFLTALSLSFLLASLAIGSDEPCTAASIPFMLESLVFDSTHSNNHVSELSKLAPKERDLVENVILPILGPRMFYTGKSTYRACTASDACISFAGSMGEKSLEIRWSGELKKPEIISTDKTRVLVIPKNMSTLEIAGDAEALVQQWTVGHSLHPFIYDAQTAKELKALGADGLKLRKAQSEATRAGIYSFESGHKSFLYVAPTGTGKTEVLTGILEHETAAARNKGKFHMMVAHQIELVDQFASNLKKLESEGKVKIIREFNLQELLNDKPGPPKVLVMTIQGLVKALEKLPPEQVKLIRAKLGTLVFDEAHHLGAPTYLNAVKMLIEDNAGAKLLAATATPVHAETGIQKLFNDTFEGHSFWAYLDHGNVGEGVERTASAVVDQLDGAIGAGELTPLEHFYVINPKTFGAEGENIFLRVDPTNPKSAFQINPEKYPSLAKRLAPLFERHKAGFVAANSIEEAERLKAAFEKTMPGKKFVVYHGKLTTAEREAIQKRMQAGENIFLITVNLLDEGVNFPHMSLYVDLNRSLGVRQLLQRWGRVARLAPGKEGVEIATLTDWEDAEFIRDKLSFLEKFASGKQGAFKGLVAEGKTTKTRDALSQVDGLTPIDDQTKKKEFGELLSHVRKIFETSTQKGPAERVTDRILTGKGLPSGDEDSGAYGWVQKIIRSDPKEWPKDLHPQVYDALIQKQKAKLDVLGPAQRVEKSVLNGKGLHFIKDDAGAASYVKKILSQDPSQWPEMNEKVREALLERWYADRGIYTTSKRIEVRVLTGKGIPTPKEDSAAHRWFVTMAARDPAEWPTNLHPKVRDALMAERGKVVETAVVEKVEPVVIVEAPKPIPVEVPKPLIEQKPAWTKETLAPVKSPMVTRLEARFDAGKGAPHALEDPEGFNWVVKTINEFPSEWPEMSDKMRDSLLKLRKSRIANLPPDGRVRIRLLEGKGLPNSTDDPSAYQWCLKMLRAEPEKWPKMEPIVRDALLERYNAKINAGAKAITPPAANVATTTIPVAKRVENWVLTNKRLPHSSEDTSVYQWAAVRLNENPAKWPPMHPEVREALMEALARKKQGLPIVPAPATAPTVKNTGKNTIERITDSVLSGKGLPTNKDDMSAYAWIREKMKYNPAKWPQDLHPKVRQALLEKYEAEKAAKLQKTGPTN